MDAHTQYQPFALREAKADFVRECLVSVKGKRMEGPRLPTDRQTDRNNQPNPGRLVHWSS